MSSIAKPTSAPQNPVPNTRLSIALLGLGLTLSAVLVGCGSNDLVQGFHIPDDKLCQLKIGQTTRPEAIAYLGMTMNSLDSQTGGLLSYQYIVVRDGQPVTTESVTLFFTESNVLTDVSVYGREAPACLKGDSSP